MIKHGKEGLNWKSFESAMIDRTHLDMTSLLQVRKLWQKKCVSCSIEDVVNVKFNLQIHLNWGAGIVPHH